MDSRVSSGILKMEKYCPGLKVRASSSKQLHILFHWGLFKLLISNVRVNADWCNLGEDNWIVVLRVYFLDEIQVLFHKFSRDAIIYINNSAMMLDHYLGRTLWNCMEWYGICCCEKSGHMIFHFIIKLSNSQTSVNSISWYESLDFQRSQRGSLIIAERPFGKLSNPSHLKI